MPPADRDNDRITFTFTDASDDIQDGSYLCGEDDAIPSVVSTWSTVDSGNWVVEEML